MIRSAKETDIPIIDHIYNQAIDHGFLTAHTRPLSINERKKWFQSHFNNNCPVFVYEEEQNVLGWASFSPYRPGREALREVAELSFYVDFNYINKGIGTQMLEYCVKMAPMLNFRILFAIVIEGNRNSINLLQKFGFENWGFLPEVVHYRGEIRGQHYMGLKLRNST